MAGRGGGERRGWFVGGRARPGGEPRVQAAAVWPVQQAQAGALAKSGGPHEPPGEARRGGQERDVFLGLPGLLQVGHRQGGRPRVDALLRGVRSGDGGVDPDLRADRRGQPRHPAGEGPRPHARGLAQGPGEGHVARLGRGHVLLHLQDLRRDHAGQARRAGVRARSGRRMLPGDGGRDREGVGVRRGQSREDRSGGVCQPAGG